MKLSKRLTQVEALITADYTHIWDTCCDHGYLGASLISHQKAPNIHLVDIVPELVASLDEKLARLFPNPNSNVQSHWQTHCLDLSELPLQQYSGKHLIIIAGIGGDLMIECMKSILDKHSMLEIDFLLCPVRHLHTLRQQLITLDMSLKKEVLVKENNLFYEILLLSSAPYSSALSLNILASNTLPSSDMLTPAIPVSPIGETMWQGKTKKEKCEAQEYLEIKIKHYQKMQRGINNPEIEKIIQAYQGIIIPS